MNAKMKQACESVADIFEALPECWTKEYRARDEYDVSVEPTDHSACKWCAIGGVSAAMNDDDSQRIVAALQPFARQLKYDIAANANDIGGREVAIKMLRLAAQS